MPHMKHRVKKEANGSRRTKVKKAGRKYVHLYLHIAGGISRDTVIGMAGRQ